MTAVFRRKLGFLDPEWGVLHFFFCHQISQKEPIQVIWLIYYHFSSLPLVATSVLQSAFGDLILTRLWGSPLCFVVGKAETVSDVFQ